MFQVNQCDGVLDRAAFYGVLKTARAAVAYVRRLHYPNPNNLRGKRFRGHQHPMRNWAASLKYDANFQRSRMRLQRSTFPNYRGQAFSGSPTSDAKLGRFTHVGRKFPTFANAFATVYISQVREATRFLGQRSTTVYNGLHQRSTFHK